MPSEYASSGEGDDFNISNVESDSSINLDIEQEFYTPSEHNHTDSEDSFTEGIVPEDGVPLNKINLVEYESSDSDEGHQWWQEREPREPVTRDPENPAPETPAPEIQAPETPAPEFQAPETQAPEIQAPETSAPEPAASETLSRPMAAVPGPSAAGPSRRSRLWAPPPGWSAVQAGYLWCPATGRLVATRKMSRHLNGNAGQCSLQSECPLRHYRDLVSYKSPAADRIRKCTCGTTIRAQKRGMRAAISGHLNKASAHSMATPDQREQLCVELLNAAWRTVTRNPVGGSGLPVLGPQKMPAPLPQPEASDPGRHLAASIGAVGAVAPAWVPGVVLTRQRQYVQVLARLLRAANITAPDWRYVVGSPEQIEQMRRVLATELQNRPPTGQSMSHAVLTFLSYVRGRLATVADGLEDAWFGKISRVMDLVRCEVKDAGQSIALHEAAKDARQQEAPMDLLKDLSSRAKMLETAFEWTNSFMADPDLTETSAVIFRQVALVIVSIFAGHRTGIWEGLRLREYQERSRDAAGGYNITHIGGKNKKSMGATTVIVEERADSIIAYYVQYLRPLLRSAATSELLFPGLQSHSFLHASKALKTSEKTLRSICRGNDCRRFHASACLYLEERGDLTPAEMRLVAFYRRHSAEVAERTYERRSRRELDAGIQRKVLSLLSKVQKEQSAGPVQGPAGDEQR